MNILTEHPLFSTAAEALGITILHSLWQGFLLLFLLALFLRFGKAKPPNTRFAVAFATLLIFLAAFGGTFYQQWVNLAPTPLPTLPTEVPTEAITVDADYLIEPTSEPITVVESSNDWETGLTRLTQLAPWLAWLWVIGSFVFGLRLINGLVQSQRLRYRTQPVPADWQQRAKKLAQQLGINQTVFFASTDRSNTPLTLGWIKPIILIPTSLLTMMPADQLETIFIHELAHIKRRDYLWNLVQSVAEVILFYHPAYWYISSVLERERELACDNLTVTITQRPRIYAQALLQVATQSTQTPLQSVAASGKRGLSERIQQIIYPGRAQRGISVLPFLLLLSAISLSLAAFSWYQPDMDLAGDEQLADSLHRPVYSDHDGYGYMDPKFLQPLNQPIINSIDYGPSFQEVMNGLSDEFLDITNLRVDEMYDQVLTIDQSLNRFSRSAAQYRGDSLAESPVNYSAPSVVYLLDGEVVDPKQLKMSQVKHYEVFRTPFSSDLQNLVDRAYSIVVRATSKQSSFGNTQGSLRPPDFIGYGQRYNFAVTLPRELATYSHEDYLIGQKDFTQKISSPWTYFRESAVYLLNGEVVDEPSSIRVDAIRRYEVYYAPLPPSLQNLTDENYSAVVRAFTKDYPVAEKSFVVRGQFTTRVEGKVQPVPGVKLKVKESGEQVMTDEVGKFRMPATPEGTLIIYWPDETVSELEIDGREFFHLIAYIPKRRAQRYQEIQKRMIQRMSENALEKDKEAIQREIDALDKAINSLQQTDTANTLTKTITGRVTDAFANQGVEGVFVKATDGTIAVTDEKGYYQIYLPAQTTNTEFEFTHPDYPTQHTKVDASVQKAVYLSLQKEEDRLIIRGERIGSLESDSSVYKVLKDRFLYDPENNAMRLLTEEELRSGTVDKSGFYTMDNPLVLFTLDGVPVDARTIRSDSVAFMTWDNQNVPQNYKFVIRAYTEKEQSLEGSNKQKSLFVIDGKVREDIRSFEGIEALNLNVKSTETLKESGHWRLPLEYQKQGYTKLVRIFTDEYNENLVDRTVQGKLADTNSGEPLVGAKISGFRNGKKLTLARTNQQGEYEMTLPEDVETVEYSHSSYNPTLVPSRRLIRANPIVSTLHLRKKNSPSKAPIFKIAKGKVTDFASGKPLKDIYVRAKGTAIGTRTNSDGEYRMKIPEFINQVEFFYNDRAEVIAAVNSRGIADTEILTDRSTELKNTLFIINGEIRKDIHSYQDVDALNLDIEHEGILDSRGLVEIPLGYRRVIRFLTKDYQLPSADQTIQGKVIDQGNKKPLAGAEIRWVKPSGKTVLAHSDEQGEYQITLTKEMNTIEYSHPGYATRSVTDDEIRKALPLQRVVPLWHESRTDDFAKQ